MHNDSAVAWKCCTTIACAIKGSRRKFQNASRSHTSVREFLDKYQKEVVHGGWGADVIGINQIAQMEPDFSHIHCDHTDMDVTSMFNGFARCCNYSKNRSTERLASLVMCPQKSGALFLMRIGSSPPSELNRGSGMKGCTKSLTRFIMHFKNCWLLFITRNVSLCKLFVMSVLAFPRK